MDVELTMTTTGYAAVAGKSKYLYFKGNILY